MKILAFVCLLINATPGFAHSGAHDPGILNSLWHLFSQPDHGLLAISFLVVCAVVIHRLVRYRARKSRRA